MASYGGGLFFGESSEIVGETEQSSENLCHICMDRKPTCGMFRTNMAINNNVCSHSFCTDCIGDYVTVKIEQDNIVNVTCPDPSCKQVIRPEMCRSILPKQVIDRWEDALCESLISASEKLYELRGLDNNGDKREREEDVMFMELAKNMKWMRCPRCNFFVDKISGCLHIKCRCSHEFCYGCGSDYSYDHACGQI